MKNNKQYLLLLIFLTITSKGLALNPYTSDELDQLAKNFVQEINQSDSVEREPLANQYINQLGKKLADAARQPRPFFFLVKSNEINAFAGPGGHIGVNSQLILSTETESELAAVMAHELAHVRLHHLYRMMEHQKQMRIPMMASLLAAAALSVLNPALGSGALMGSLTGFSQDNINFIRSNEKEADRIGIDMLIRSGLNPRGMIQFFRKMQLNSRYYYTDNIPAILRTHPMDDDRISEAENRSISKPGQTFSDNIEYHLFKELIRNGVTNDHRLLLEYYNRECRRANQAAVCEYGEVLTLLKLNRFQQAKNRMALLLNTDHNNLFYQLAMARAETGNQEHAPAVQRLEELHNLHPENYAVLMAHAQSLLAANHTEKAASVLLKGSRKFKQDLPLCQALARAQAEARHKAFAYFTQAQCQLLQGKRFEALRKLKLVKSLAKKDPYLTARAEALMEDIKFREKRD